MKKVLGLLPLVITVSATAAVLSIPPRHLRQQFEAHTVVTEVPVPREGVYQIRADFRKRISATATADQGPSFYITWDALPAGSSTNSYLRIDSSTDLVHWVAIERIFGDRLRWDFATTNDQKRFFRVIVEPSQPAVTLRARVVDP